MNKNKNQVIETIQEAMKSSSELYDAIAYGDITHKKAMELFFSRVGDEVLTALKEALDYIREGK